MPLASRNSGMFVDLSSLAYFSRVFHSKLLSFTTAFLFDDKTFFLSRENFIRHGSVYLRFYSSSYRIGPFEVESALIEHEAVAEAAVVSSPDPVRGEVKFVVYWYSYHL